MQSGNGQTRVVNREHSCWTAWLYSFGGARFRLCLPVWRPASFQESPLRSSNDLLCTTNEESWQSNRNWLFMLPIWSQQSIDLMHGPGSVRHPRSMIERPDDHDCTCPLVITTRVMFTVFRLNVYSTVVCTAPLYSSRSREDPWAGSVACTTHSHIYLTIAKSMELRLHSSSSALRLCMSLIMKLVSCPRRKERTRNTSAIQQRIDCTLKPSKHVSDSVYKKTRGYKPSNKAVAKYCQWINAF